MDDIVNVWMLVEDLVESCFVGDIDFVKSRFRPSEEFDPIKNLFRRVI
jgi:hypothetical protein